MPEKVEKMWVEIIDKDMPKQYNECLKYFDHDDIPENYITKVELAPYTDIETKVNVFNAEIKESRPEALIGI